MDAIESALVTSGLVADQAAVGSAGYLAANRIALSCLGAGLDVVIDAVNPVEVARQGWRELGTDVGADVLFVEVICSDRERHRRQVEQRVSDLRDWDVPDWEAVVSRDYEPWQGQRLVIDNLDDDPEAQIALIADQMNVRPSLR